MLKLPFIKERLIVLHMISGLKKDELSALVCRAAGRKKVSLDVGAWIRGDHAPKYVSAVALAGVFNIPVSVFYYKSISFSIDDTICHIQGYVSDRGCGFLERDNPIDFYENNADRQLERLNQSKLEKQYNKEQIEKLVEEGSVTTEKPILDNQEPINYNGGPNAPTQTFEEIDAKDKEIDDFIEKINNSKKSSDNSDFLKAKKEAIAEQEEADLEAGESGQLGKAIDTIIDDPLNQGEISEEEQKLIDDLEGNLDKKEIPEDNIY